MSPWPLARHGVLGQADATRRAQTDGSTDDRHTGSKRLPMEVTNPHRLARTRSGLGFLALRFLAQQV